MALKTQGTELFYVATASTVVKVGRITGVTGTGGANDQIETTDLDSIEKEYIAGLPNPGAASTPLNFDPAVTIHRDLYTLWQTGGQVRWIVALADGSAPPTVAASVVTYPITRTYFDFMGYISDFPVDAATNSKLETPMTIQRSGPKTPRWKT